MDFAALSKAHRTWRGILAFGRDATLKGTKCHVIGVTLEEEGELYLLERCGEGEPARRRGPKNYRGLLKEAAEGQTGLLDCQEIVLGRQTLPITEASRSRIGHSDPDYGEIQVFFDFMSAGWKVPEWLKTADWETLGLTVFKFSGKEGLPQYSAEMPITFRYRPAPARHIVEKTVAIPIGKSRNFRFQDHEGEWVDCYIDQARLLDVWKQAEETWKRAGETSPQMDQRFFKTLERCCPRGMYYTEIEYECGKDLELRFYSKEYLRSRPGGKNGNVGLAVFARPDREIGPHGLPLKTCVIDTPVHPDIERIDAELFCCYEKTEPWEETV